MYSHVKLCSNKNNVLLLINLPTRLIVCLSVNLSLSFLSLPSPSKMQGVVSNHINFIIKHLKILYYDKYGFALTIIIK